jgi:uncharacterized membrane protein YphA (DoxX/SURF4 family)
VPLIISGLSKIHEGLQALPLIVPAVAVASGFFLMLGLWTPLAGSCAALIDMYNAISRAGDEQYHIVLAAVALSIVMLGPGAWSIDARLYGRRRIDF